jgi:preprotein translocase subunit SecY
MLDSFANMFRIPELRKKILFTLGILIVYRFGCLLPCPGVNTQALEKLFGNMANQPLGNLLGFAAALSGGALSKSTVFCLGIMPYISATIIFQLLTGVVPALERLRKEGESGLKKIRQYERYTTVVLCIFQGWIYVQWLRATPPIEGLRIIDPYWAVCVTAVIVMATGTMILMWLGDQITQFGVGNGISLIIMAGIIDRLPVGLWQLFGGIRSGNVSLGMVVFLIAAFVVIVAGVVLITQGQRRIPTQQAKHTRGRHVVGGGRQFLPFRVNHAGVMPIIFASTLLMFPTMALAPFQNDQAWASWVSTHIFGWGNWPYILGYIILIFFFSYFWTSLMFKPKDISDNLKDYGSFIPGIRPGRKTAEYLEYIMVRITLAGSAFLAIIAIIPQLMRGGMEVGVLAGIYGGTSILIVVGVALDLVEKIESHLMMRHYEGFMRKGRIRGRR